MNSSSIPSRIALVSGAARGIGAAIAERLAQDGYDLALLDLDAANCDATRSEVEALGRRAACFGADVSCEADVRRVFAEISESFGAPVVLVNNAGVLKDRTLGRMTIEDWDTVIDVNLKSVFLMCREALPFMKEAGWGRIVNLSSIAALGVFGEANYSAAKAGIQGLTKTLAVELGPNGITANAVAPGFVVTEMTRAVAERAHMTIDELSDLMMRDIVVGRTGLPEDIANAVSFFADERSSFVTGQVLYVAGAPRG